MLQIAVRRMAKHDRARCLTGRIEDLAPVDASYDVVVIHNALHEVPDEERLPTVKSLAKLLRPGGRLCFREPTKQPHGLPSGAYRELMDGAGLHEVHS
jgi:ubiquinone/menaquinone biosynthesis C-methylase UbiE